MSGILIGLVILCVVLGLALALGGAGDPTTSNTQGPQTPPEPTDTERAP